MGTIDDVRERLPIEQIVGERVALKRAGASLKGLCPFHNEKTPSFIVTPSKGIYKCFGCLPPGQLIKTQHGMRPIEEIRVGDLVYTDKGRLRPVLLTHEHMYAGELVKLTCAPFKVPILLTPNHKVPILRPRSRKRREIEAGAICPQNYLIYPSISRAEDILSWDVRPEWERRYKVAPKPLPSSVDLDSFAEWLGWYIAEGSVSNDRTVRFSLCSDEIEQAHRLQRLTQELFGCNLEIRLTKGRSLEAWFCHTLLARWLKHHCGNGARNKRLPTFIWSWTSHRQWMLFHSLMMGDGRMRPAYTTKNGVAYPPSWTFVSSSAALVDDVRDLLLVNGVIPSTMREGRGSSGRSAWYMSVNPAISDVWGVEHAQVATRVRVRKVERVFYHGPVYNLTVDEDHTYVTMSGAVCNCGEGGDIFTFVMKTQNMDFPTALRELAARAGVEVEDAQQGRASGALETRIYDLNAAAATYFQSMLAAPAGTRAREYLERRRIAATTVDRFALGYAPDTRDGLCARLRAAGHPDEDIVAAGLGIVSDEGGPMRDRFRGRLIFPIRDAKGRILGFGGRVMGDGEPKYLNSPATAVFDKSRVLYTIEHAADAIRSSREAVVVEGYVDALRAHQEGFPNVVATLGTAITEYHLRALKRLAPRLVLALDADPAGQKAAVRAGLVALGTLSADTKAAGRDATQVHIVVATLPQGQDPDDAIAADPEVWRRAVAEAAPLMDHYFTLVEAGLDRSRAEWRQEALDTLTPAIGQLPGLGLQQSYIERLSTLTGIDARYLRDITPGGAPSAATRGRDTRRRGVSGTPPAAPPLVDPVRVTEEYVAGLLLLHRPLPREVRDELAAYTPSTPNLASLFAALPGDMELSAEDEDLVERLTAAVARQPAVPSDKVLTVLRVCLLRLEGERTRREIIQFGHTVTEVDADTAREMDGSALQALTLKEQLVARLQKEQSQQWRRPVAAGDSE